jgi:saccharopine dehydrogenase-like NADP-dependent oxidoreductase
VRNHKALVQSLKGISIVLNFTWFELYMDVFLAASEAKVHYIDLGGLYYGTMKQL